MNNLGNFLELSVHSGDILESMSFYRSLGFEEMATTDAWPHKYAVMSDGAINIGLHDREFDSPALSFVHPELARHARSMADHGFDFTYLQLDEDVFNELGFKDRDAHLIAMQEARTFTPGDEYENDSACGNWFELTLPVRDAVRAAAFWAPLAPVMLQIREEPTVHMRFDAGGIPLGLSESIALEEPSLCFRCQDKVALKKLVEHHGLRYQKFPGFEGAFMVLKAPEGTHLYVFDEDFLGESYEVDESGDAEEFPDL